MVKNPGAWPDSDFSSFLRNAQNICKSCLAIWHIILLLCLRMLLLGIDLTTVILSLQNTGINVCQSLLLVHLIEYGGPYTVMFYNTQLYFNNQVGDSTKFHP